MGEDARQRLESQKEAMNVIIYTQDFEPITVIDLPMWVLDNLEKHGRARIKAGSSEGADVKYEVVDIYCAKIRWIDGSLKPILVTPDEVIFLKAKASWLPGQKDTVTSYKEHIKSITNRLIKAMRKD